MREEREEREGGKEKREERNPTLIPRPLKIPNTAALALSKFLRTEMSLLIEVSIECTRTSGIEGGRRRGDWRGEKRDERRVGEMRGMEEGGKERRLETSMGIKEKYGKRGISNFLERVRGWCEVGGERGERGV